VAQACVLLHDERSPVYSAFEDVTVADAAIAARAALTAGADGCPVDDH
jgi:hypothetical protein